MNWEKHIVRDRKIFGGKPTVKGTRISVDLIMSELGWGMTDADIIEYHYPYLAAEDIAACREYVAAGEPMACITDPKIDALLAAGNDDDCPKSEEPGMGWVGRIVSTPGLAGGRPRLKSSRTTVAEIMRKLDWGQMEEEILAYFTELMPADIAACREFAATGEPLTYRTSEEADAFWDVMEYVDKLKRKAKGNENSG